MFWEEFFDEESIPDEARFFILLRPINEDPQGFLAASEPVVNATSLFFKPLDDDEDETEGSDAVDVVNIPFIVERLPQRFFDQDEGGVSPGRNPQMPHAPGGNQPQIPPPPPAPAP